MTEHRHIGWLRATALAALIIGVTALGFLYVPDQLALKLAASPGLRDGLVVMWTSLFFAVACWAFVRLQVRRIPERAGAEREPREGATR
jgi:hypothetical protein